MDTPTSSPGTPTSEDKKPKKDSFSDAEVFALIEHWNENFDVIEKQVGNKTEIYLTIALKLKEQFPASLLRTHQQIKRKIQNLKARYRTEKREQGPSGGKPISWTFYQAVHQVLHARPAENLDAAITDETGMEDEEKENVNPNSDSMDGDTQAVSEPTKAGKENSEEVPASPPPKKRGRVSEQLLSVCKASLKLMEKAEARRTEERKKLDEQSDKLIEFLGIMAKSVQAIAAKSQAPGNKNPEDQNENFEG